MSGETRSGLLEFLGTIARPGSALGALGDDDNLIDVGAIDSLAMLHIIMYLEQTHGVSLAASGIDPGELVSIGGILRAIAGAS